MRILRVVDANWSNLSVDCIFCFKFVVIGLKLELFVNWVFNSNISKNWRFFLISFT